MFNKLQMGWGFFFRAGSDNMDILIYINVGFSLEQAMNTLTNMKATIKWIHEFDTEVVWILFPGNVSKRFTRVVWQVQTIHLIIIIRFLWQ